MLKKNVSSKRTKKKSSSMPSVAMNHDERHNVATLFAILMQVNQRIQKTSGNKKTKDKDPKLNYSKKARLTAGPLLLWVLSYILQGLHNMIDTVVLLLSSDSYTITNPERFIPSAHWATEKSRGSHGIVSKQNPTVKELRAGTYKPRLTLSHRMNVNGKFDTILRVELSLPKLLFGNNFDELRLKDFSAITEKLASALVSMGVETTPIKLARAPIATVHYSKNIALTDGSTPHYFISKIKEANIPLSRDTNQTNYRNDGHSFKWHCNSYEVVFYDKIQDLAQAQRSSKRSIEKESTLQLDIFKRLEQRKKLEILRMEVRLNKRVKIKNLFQSLGIKSNLTFKSIFKSTVSKKILLHYLNEIESKRPALLNYKADDKTMLTALIVNNPEMSSKQILQIYGLQQALKVTNIRELRNMFAQSAQRSWPAGRSSQSRAWARLMADVQKIKLPTGQQPFGVVREQLVKFKPTKL